MLETYDYIFYALAIFTLVCGLSVILVQNPIYCALYLAITMVSIAGLFVTLEATFVAGVQLIVYAGAVMVLFVMVIMLFDIKHEHAAFSKGLVSGVIKLVSVASILGILAGSIYMSAEMVLSPQPAEIGAAIDPTKQLAEILFTKYLFAFEFIGVLLLIIAVGAVTLSRISGGTHADD